MRFLRDILFVGVIAIFCALLSGCPLLMIGGFAYTGYQYHEKEGVFAPGQPLGGPAPADQDEAKGQSSPASRPSPSANDIE
jgi:hypothetical protein